VRNGRALAHATADGLLGFEHAAGTAAASLLVLLGFVCALRAGPSLLDWFTLAQGALVLVYLVVDERLLLPLLPGIACYLLAGVGALLRPVLQGQLQGFHGVALSLVTALAVSSNLDRLPRALQPHRPDRPPLEASWFNLERAAAWVRAQTPGATHVLCDAAPQMSVLSGRPAYSFRFIATREPPAAILRRYSIDVAVFTGPDSPLEAFAASVARRRWMLAGHPHGGSVRIYRISNRDGPAPSSASSPP
jgi:hypothetical protein